MDPRLISAKYDPDTLTVDFLAEDGSHFLRTGGSIAWRFNNPGNIRPTSSGKLIMGAIGIGETKGNGSFLIFATYEEGRMQKKSLLRRKYNDRTIYTMLAGIPDSHGKLVMGYAPASDHNDPAAYARSISEHTGLPVTTKLSDISDEQLEGVLDAMEKKEGFHAYAKSRSSGWIHATTVTLSDGMRPKPDVPVKIDVNGAVSVKSTDAFGQLPPILHLLGGEKVEISCRMSSGDWEKQLEFETGSESQTFLLVNDALRFSSVTEVKKISSSTSTTVRAPIRYVVRAGDTLSKIAGLFNTTLEALKKSNPDIKNASKIYVGQEIGIYGSLSEPELPGNKNRTNGQSFKNEQLPEIQIDVVRSKDGHGEPLAIIPVEQAEVPWMTCALREAKRFKGENEKDITKEENYHKDIGTSGTLSGTPWCASFVNFCLKSSGTPYEISASSQFPVGSKKFIKIDKPVYGALMVLRNYVKSTGKFAGSGHVTFVYGKTKEGKIAGLGGNQHDTIKLSSYASSGIASEYPDSHGILYEQRFYGFYIPATYSDYAKKEKPLDVVEINDVNKNVFNIKSAKTVIANESTR